MSDWDLLWYNKDNRTTVEYHTLSWIKKVRAEGDKMQNRLKRIKDELDKLHSSGSGYMSGDAIDGIRKILEVE